MNHSNAKIMEQVIACGIFQRCEAEWVNFRRRDFLWACLHRGHGGAGTHQEAVMLSKAKLAFVGALAILAHAAFADGSAPTVPTTNIESACRDAQAAAPPDSKSAAY
jgi:hypothetical protein